MKFSRSLNRTFIASLNNLYTDEKSWWRKIVDDKEVFILIRNNEIRVQVNGGLLLQINQDRQNRIVCRTHEEFLSLRSDDNPYVVLEENTTAPIQRVEGLTGFVKHYSKIKRRINIFTGKEKSAVQYIANHFHQVVDLEIGFEGELKENAKKKSAPRIDMAAITDAGILVFYEVKLFDNSEIRSQKTPKVVKQLQQYENLLSKNKSDIIKSYKNQMNIYKQLKGRFFVKRARDFNNVSIYPKARLIITGFDTPQRDIMLPTVREGIEKGIGWETGTRDIIATGNHSSITKSNRIFIGL